MLHTVSVVAQQRATLGPPDWPRVGWFLSRRIDELYGGTDAFRNAFATQEGRNVSQQAVQAWVSGGRIKWKSYQSAVERLCRWAPGSIERMVRGGTPVVDEQDTALGELTERMEQMTRTLHEMLNAISGLQHQVEGLTTRPADEERQERP